MLGQYKIRITDSKICYNFTISRNITIINGNSGTGKTTLVDLIDNSRSNDDISITVESTLDTVPELRTLRGNDTFWKITIPLMKNTILFLDEDCEFMSTKEFAEVVKNSECYFVLITRNSLEMLPYSIEEIYEITVDKHYPNLKKTYNTLVRRYKDFQGKVKPDLILVEDSKSGYQFVQRAFTAIPCKSCNGKSNIVSSIKNIKEKNILIIVDGAAFGSNADRLFAEIMNKNYTGKHVVIFAPESFEWLILRSNLFYNTVRENLESTYNYADSKKYESWEQYYTSLLIKITLKTPAQYNKANLNKFYLHGAAKKALMKMYDLLEDPPFLGNLKPLNKFD